MKSGLKKNGEARMTNGGKLNRYKVKRLKSVLPRYCNFQLF
jgi:hypothetical protein